MCSTEYPELLEELDRLERKTPPAGKPLSPAQNDRICRMALDRISGGVPALSAQTQTEEQRKGAKNMETKKKTGRTLRRTVRISLIAAALICASAATVYAVGPQLIEMLGENIGFFQEAPSQQEVDDPLDAPRGCAYAPRCPRRTPLCAQERPQLGDEAAGHRAACHHL